jgi:subfamily B ATP-binding cassette protein MsbA
MYLVFIFSIIASLLEGFGILMLLPLFESLGEKSNTLNENQFNFYFYEIIDYLGWSTSTISVLNLIVIVFIFKGLITMIALAINSYLIGDLLKGIKINLFEYYTKMSFSYYSSKNTGDFINLIAEQPNRAIESFKQLINFGSYLINTIVLIFIAFSISSSFGGLAVSAGLILLFLFLKLNSYVQRLSRISAFENSNLNKWLVQVLHAFKYLTSTNQIKKLKNYIFNSIEILTSNHVKSGISAAFTQSIREPLAVILIIAIIYFQLIIFEQRLEPILVSIALFYRALSSTLAVQSSFQGTFQFIGSMEMINDEYKNQKLHRIKDGFKKINYFQRQIKFDNVSFTHDNSNKCLDSVNLIIDAKTSVGIVGESGSGKTTLVDLITLLHDNIKGKILIDGILSDEIEKENWRNQIGYISQDTVIFDDTIANNISMWDKDLSNKLDKLKEVAQQANILDFINSLSEGFDTKVGDRGIKLSGGQKQRLFIARELYREPSILILDEATSALDSISENKIQKSIENIQGELTLIIIAHRISTIRKVDKIFKLDKGKIIKIESYEKLEKSFATLDPKLSNKAI